RSFRIPAPARSEPYPLSLHDALPIWSGSPQALVNPSTEVCIAETSADGLDLAAALAFAREEGGRALRELDFAARGALLADMAKADRKSTRLNSSHVKISYAVFCLKKK